VLGRVNLLTLFIDWGESIFVKFLVLTRKDKWVDELSGLMSVDFRRAGNPGNRAVTVKVAVKVTAAEFANGPTFPEPSRLSRRLATCE
jgi:hypothetical protein